MAIKKTATLHQYSLLSPCSLPPRYIFFFLRRTVEGKGWSAAAKDGAGQSGTLYAAYSWLHCRNTHRRSTYPGTWLHDAVRPPVSSN